MIFLIRHGETDGNARRVVQMPETPLSERGVQQAQRLGRRLAGEGVERILVSDYARAAMTADAVQVATGAELEVHSELRERNYGDLRGRPYTEVGEYIMMEGYEPPSGESWETFHSRVDRAWERSRAAVERTRGNLAIVTHGLVCYSLLLRHLDLGGSETPTHFGNTSLTVIESSHPWSVELLACCEHLEEGEADDTASPSGI